MSEIGLPLNPGTLPYSCYPADPQTFYRDMFTLGAANATALTGVVMSSSTPDPENQDKLWIKLNASDAPIGQFAFMSGVWVWPHQVPPSSSERRMWVGIEADLTTYDGGDASGIGAASGPMWEVDHLFDGRSPMGPGTIPNTPDTLVVATNYGEGRHTMLDSEIAPHTHILQYRTLGPGAGQVGSPTGPAVGNTAPFDGQLTTDANVATPTPFNVVHPVRGCFIIKRTTRLYYRG